MSPMKAQDTKIKVKEGMLSAGPGHFDFSIDMINRSPLPMMILLDLDNFIYDWKKYEYVIRR